MKTALGYIRRSKESTERTVSLGVQMEAIERYAETHELDLVDFVIDDGVSGGIGTRLDNLLRHLAERGAENVVVAHHDRLARKVSDALGFVETCSRVGIKVHVADAGVVEVETAEGYLSTAINGVLAEHYRILVKQKTRAALSKLKMNGRRYCNVPPYGYAVGPAGTLVRNACEQTTIETIKALARQGLTLRAIAKILEASGHLNRHGERFSASSISNLIKRR